MTVCQWSHRSHCVTRQLNDGDIHASHTYESLSHVIMPTQATSVQWSLSLPTLGRVCVPIDVASVEEFSPFEVPIVNQLCNELDESGNSEDKKPGYTYWSHKTCPFLHPWLRNKPLLLQHNVYVTHICPALSLHSPGYARTTLSTYIQHFSQFVLSLKHDPTQRRHKTRQGWYMVVKIFPLLNSFPIFFQYRSWLLTPSSTHGC